MNLPSKIYRYIYQIIDIIRCYITLYYNVNALEYTKPYRIFVYMPIGNSLGAKKTQYSEQ